MSSHDLVDTIRRLRDAVAGMQMAVFAEIDHASAAANAGIAIQPMRVLLFGSAVAATPLLQSSPTIGIDLPLRALVWTDAEGNTWLAYNDPGWIAARHGARRGNDRVLAGMREALAALGERVTRPDGSSPNHIDGESGPSS
jgi:uncharacterized protein (DUF302 family)